MRIVLLASTDAKVSHVTENTGIHTSLKRNETKQSVKGCQEVKRKGCNKNETQQIDNL